MSRLFLKPNFWQRTSCIFCLSSPLDSALTTIRAACRCCSLRLTTNGLVIDDFMPWLHRRSTIPTCKQQTPLCANALFIVGFIVHRLYVSIYQCYCNVYRVRCSPGNPESLHTWLSRPSWRSLGLCGGPEPDLRSPLQPGQGRRNCPHVCQFLASDRPVGASDTVCSCRAI